MKKYRVIHVVHSKSHHDLLRYDLFRCHMNILLSICRIRSTIVPVGLATRHYIFTIALYFMPCHPFLCPLETSPELSEWS